MLTLVLHLTSVTESVNSTERVFTVIVEVSVLETVLPDFFPVKLERISIISYTEKKQKVSKNKKCAFRCLTDNVWYNEIRDIGNEERIIYG